MHFIYAPENRDWWVAASDAEKTEKNLCRVVEHATGLLTDLDETLGPSPAKREPLYFVRDPRNWLGLRKEKMLALPRFTQWVFGTAYKLIRMGKAAESERWFILAEQLLCRPDVAARIASRYDPVASPGYVRSQLYIAVKDFFSATEISQKGILSRNVDEIVRAYVTELGMTYRDSLVHDKAKALDTIVGLNRGYRRLLLFGDSQEDTVALERARELAGYRGPLDSVVGFWVAKSPAEKHTNPAWDYNIGRNWVGMKRIQAQVQGRQRAYRNL